MPSSKLTHGGKRSGAGRKPAPFPHFLKKFRATDEERTALTELMTGDARQDFLIVLNAVRIWRKRNKTLEK
jgi:hypothetical protein